MEGSNGLTPEDIELNNIISAKMLFKSDFKPSVEDEQMKKKILLLKLNDEYRVTLEKYKKLKEKEEEQRLREGKKEKKEDKKDDKDTSFITKLVNEITTTPKDKAAKIKTFEDYSERVSTKLPEESTALVVSKKLELGLAQTTKLGTIKASSIRKLIRPTWHRPFKLYRVVAAHQGWVRCISVSPDNNFFCTGSNDRTIKFWDLASGKLKITLTGHINAVRGVQLSRKHPYLFSCAEDKTVKCWDLEMNKVVRNYHGHLSGVYALKIHERLNLLVTGGRDSAARVWDMRLRTQVHVLTGHAHTVGSVATQQFQPQIITGGYDSMVKTWDLAAGKCLNTLTNHKKAIRALLVHPTQYTFASAASDNIKVWKCPQSEFLRNISGHNSIIDCVAINHENVFVSGGDDGSLKLWDWKSGYNFQSILTKPQPGSIAAENGIFGCAFDMSGTRLITAECDKTIKFYREDEEATEQTHPIKDFKIEFQRR